MTDKLIEQVARAIWDRPLGYKRVPYDLLDMEDQDVFRAYARAAIAAIEAAGTHRVVPVVAQQKRWHVVSDWDTRVELDGTPYDWRGLRPNEDEHVWTVSRYDDRTGWETDSGYPGYGLTYAEAKELADAANLIAAAPKVAP